MMVRPATPPTALALGCLLCLAVALPPGLQAQTPPTSREQELLQAQAEKARTLTPEGPNRAEQLLSRLEPVVLAQLPQGVYPWFGSVLGGGWMALGAGYRTAYSDTGRLNVVGGWSLKNYRMIQADLLLPTFMDGRGRVEVYGKYLFADKVAFYGLGPESLREDRTSFTYEPTTFGARAVVEPLPWLHVGGGYGYEGVNTGEGQSGLSVEEVFPPSAAPGFGENFTYLVPSAWAAIDYRNGGPGYSTRGGLYRIEYRRYDDRDDGRWTFDGTQVELRQYIPILRENWVIAVRALGTVTYGRDGGEVPFFMMPTLGSGGDLRAFSNRRFRDRHRVLVQAEYRWRPSKFLDLALFYDAGKVASVRRDLDFDDLETAWGFGARIHGPSSTFIRWDVAKSREGWKFIWAGGPSF
jgi:hypothetical protein